MKRLFCLMLVVLGTAAFTACSDDDDNNGGNGNENKRMVKRIYLKDNPGYKGYDFFYDENNRPIHIVNYDGGQSIDRTYTYSDSGQEIVCDYEPFGIISTYFLDNQGLIYKRSDDNDNDYYYQYNDSNQLINQKDRESTCTYLWQNGNLVRMTGEQESFNFEFTTEENKSNLDFGPLQWEEFILDEDPLQLFGFTGSTCKNYIKKYSSDGREYSFVYTFDENGYATEIELTTNGEDKEVYIIEYCD